ncbi:MAG: hypothetical protein WCK89_15715, partial [bacterium]
MRPKSSSGLTLVEAVVCLVVVILLFAALLPAIPLSGMQANMSAVAIRGRDIFVAITGANTEREALGLPPVWPCDFDPTVITNAEERALLGASTSTDYFRELYDEKRLGTSGWAPYVAGFDYAKLAGAGVGKSLSDEKLTATNNMWTIAKNVRDDMDDI